MAGSEAPVPHHACSFGCGLNEVPPTWPDGGSGVPHHACAFGCGLNKVLPTWPDGGSGPASRLSLGLRVKKGVATAYGKRPIRRGNLEDLLALLKRPDGLQ